MEKQICPACGQVMKKVGNEHWHCPNPDCGVCLNKGQRYTWFKPSEVQYCPKKSDWPKDPYIKTSGLS